MALARDIHVFTSTLRSQGAQAGIAYLNEGVPHRYTAVYRIEGGLLRNVLLHDKLGEVRPDFLEVVRFEDSFCQFVLRDGAFRTDNSALDTRLDGHPYQGAMICYHGVPMLGREGELIGTLCHFDVKDLGVQDAEFGLLTRAGRVLSDFLPA